MSNELHTIRTATATVSLVEPGIIERRYHDDAQLSTEAIKENAEAVETLCAHNGPCGLLSLIPAGMQVRPDLMNVDHYRDARDKGHIRAIALVADSTEVYTALKLYLLYHQQPFATAAFEEEFEARKWLREKLASRRSEE